MPENERRVGMAGISCGYGQCHKQAIYFIGRMQNELKQFGYVCGQHDRESGIQNLIDAFGLTYFKAKELNVRLNKEAKLEDGG